MAKYNYSRKGLKGLTPFPFLGEVKTRLKAIEAAPDTMPQSIYNANILAAKLHPAVQHVRIASIVDHGATVGDYVHLAAGAMVQKGTKVPDGIKVSSGEIF